LLLYVKENYGNPTVYITENGNFYLLTSCRYFKERKISPFLKELNMKQFIYKIATIHILGIDEDNNQSLSLQEALKDDARIEFHRKHLLALQSAVRSVVELY
jgi:beta-glucosidase